MLQDEQQCEAAAKLVITTAAMHACACAEHITCAMVALSQGFLSLVGHIVGHGWCDLKYSWTYTDPFFLVNSRGEPGARLMTWSS